MQGKPSEELISQLLEGRTDKEETNIHVTVEEKVRISQSKLITAHTNFYESWGPTAWRVIPDYISTNSFVAASYGKIIMAYIKDLVRNNAIQIPNKAMTTPSEPIDLWIVELGAGTGNLSYLLIRFLSQSFPPLFITQNNIEYPIALRFVLTDFAERNVAYWEEHGYFREFIKKGMVDFAVYNVLEDEKIYLKHSRKELCRHSLDNPVILIGNYLIDTLPHDAFRVTHETISEVTMSYQVSHLPDDPLFPSVALKKTKWEKRIIFPPPLYEGDEIFSAEQLREEEKRREREEGDNPNTRPLPPEFQRLIYYKQKEYPEAEVYNELLDMYRLSFPARSGSFLFPLGGCQMISQLEKTFGTSMLLLVGDKGSVALSDFEGKTNPRINVHGGSLSFLTNFHALKEYWRTKMSKGITLLANSAHQFKVCAFVGGTDERQGFELVSTFKQVDQFGPDDYYRIYKSINANAKAAVIHSLLRLSNNDPGMFFQYKDRLLTILPKSSWKEDIIMELIRMWGNYYHRVSSVEEDIPYGLGEIFLACDRSDDALPFFKKSLQLSGNFYSTNYHIGLCYEKLGNIREALCYYQACKEAEIDVEIDDVDEKIVYLQTIIDKEEEKMRKKQQQEEQERKAKQIEKERKELKNRRALNYSEGEKNSSISNSMNSRMSKYGESSKQEEQAESEESEEDEEIIDDDYSDDPLCF